MPEQFSQETLTEIFKYLNDDEHGSDDLFNCLLINRYWCKAAIPVLWSAPFKYADVLPLDGVIDAYVACLTKKEHEELLGKGVIIDHPIPKKVAFDYINYLKDFNYFGLMASLFHWGCGSTGTYKINNLYSYMLPAFLRIFARREIRLKSLELVNRDGLGVWENEFMHLVKPASRKLIEPVQKLYLDMEIVDGKFFTRLSE
ncbi:6062_t:CDS:1, partial [Acaulospora colombiana]